MEENVRQAFETAVDGQRREAEHRADLAEKVVAEAVTWLLGGEPQRACDLLVAALDTTDGLAEKLGAPHVEQHEDSHAAAVRSLGRHASTELTARPGGSDKPGRT